ncbi:hypothetical protein COL922a_012510 [Colletotrichum nupharicola]|nr:hypothetical protein COL922a_012510 [Colletotrichum nupharicola]
MPLPLIDVLPCIVAKTSRLEAARDMFEGFFYFILDVFRDRTVVFDSKLTANYDSTGIRWHNHGMRDAKVLG